MSQSNFNIINAAAGSGKTYTLVLYYLKQLLGAKKPRPYRQMLALTFTNKAVNEMKVRILEALHDLSKTPSQNIELQEQLSQDLEIRIDELTRRAETMLRNIVLEYGSFDVITLDKFTHRIVRTFAKEFELPKGFEVVLDSKSILDQVVQSIIDQIGKDELITQLLLELSLSKIRQGMSWDIQSDLDDFAALLLNENDRIPLADLRKKDRQTHKKDQEQLKNSLKQTKERIKNKTSEYWDRAFKEAGLLANPVNDFGDWLDDEHVKAIEGYGIVEQPEVGKVPIARLPGGLKMDGIAPNIGSNTKDVMLEYGYSLDQVEQLNREKVVFAPELSN